MNSYRLYTLIGLVILLLVGSYGWNRLTEPPVSETVSSETASVSLERSTSNSDKSADELIAFWQGRVQNAPSDYISMTYLGQAYLNKARETADVSNYNKAEEALEAALEINPDYLAATAFLGSVRFSQHEFETALELAADVFAKDDSALLALALMGDSHLELGRYDAAEMTYQSLAELNNSPPVLSRLARLAWLKGETETAVSLLTQAETEAAEMGLSGENMAWYQFQVGELYFHQGDLDRAAAQYAAALDTYPDYYLGIVGQAKIAESLDNIEEAIALYEQVVARVPQPTYIASLGNLHLANNDMESAEAQFELIEAIVTLEASQGILFNQQIAKFYMNQNRELDQALTIATQELNGRQDVYSYDLMAWALYKNGRYDEAAEAIAEALRLNTQDASFYYHAGMIYDAQGETTLAKEMFTTALDINPYFDMAQAQLAQEKLLAYENGVGAEGS